MHNPIIGIIGGMGPAASIALQQLILDITQAKTDQEHIPVITYSNTQIPDRTKSLIDNGGNDYIKAVQKTAEILINAGAKIICITCNTAHAKIADLKKSLPPTVIFVDMVEETVTSLEKLKISPVGILGSDGSIQAGIYQKN